MQKHKGPHKWNQDPPVPLETFCETCGSLYTGRGRKRKGALPVTSSVPSATDVLANVAADMAGMDSADGGSNGQRIDSASDTVGIGGSDSVGGSEVVPTPPPTWCRMAGKQIADAYVLIVRGSLRRFGGREAKDPEDDNVEELGTALGEQLAIWFPDTEMSPMAKIGIAAAAVTATMVVGSTPVQPPARSVGSRPATVDVAPSEGQPTVIHPPASSDVKLPAGLL